MGEARLIASHVPSEPRGVVLVLHGGGSRRGSMMVSPAQLSVLRMVPVAWRVAREARRHLAVYRLLNSHRGWDTAHTPVTDVRWALDELRTDLPVGLVGHSLGGRAALLAGGLDAVRSVVALNPYVLAQDRPDLRRARTLVVHGDQDRIASPARSAALVDRLPAAAPATFVTVPEARHAMLRRGRTFEALAARFTAAVLLGRDPSELADPTVRSALAGARRVTVP